MPGKSQDPYEAPSLPNEADVRAELHRILCSAPFAHSQRLSEFLRYVVDRTLARQPEALKEYAIGVAVFGRKEQFDSRVDPIVRVEAGRLRQRLEQFYAAYPPEYGLRIELPKGSYAPRFIVQRGLGRPLPLPAAALQTERITVLPVEDFSETGTLSRLCRVLTVEIIHALTQAGLFEVAAGRETDESASPRLMLATSVRDVNDAVRVTVQLIREPDRTCLWSHAFERAAGNPVEIQEEIPRSIAGLLRRRCAAGREIAARPAMNLAAYNLYLKGRQFWNLRSEEGLRKALQYFTEAVSEDPRYALAYAGLADCYTLLANYGFASPEDVRPRAKECALRAVEIDSLLPEARTSLAHVHGTYEWDWQSAELEYRAAIQLNPDYATAHHWYAITLLTPLGRLEEAAAEMERALERDPISVSVYRDLGLIHFYRRDYSGALEQARRTQVLDPQFAGGFWLMGLICEQLGMIGAAIAAFDKAVAVSGGNPRMLGALAHARALSGDRDAALAILSRLQGLEKIRYVSPFETALIRMGLRDLDEAMLWLRRAFDVRSYELVTLGVDPRYDPIRHRAEYEAMFRDLRQ